MDEIKKILNSEDKKLRKALFQFNSQNTEEEVILKFNLWARDFFPNYFKAEDAPFHKEIDTYNLRVYRAELLSFTDIAFRGAAKSVRTKLFVGYCIANDTDHFRRYFKVLSKDLANSKQIVTDVYNMFVKPKVREYYPEVFEKTLAKREETMGVFTTATGIKMTSDTVGTDQRGQVQEDARPDFVWFEDFETRKTLRSLVETKTIWDNMEEARTGLSKNGGCVYTCNYFSESGNVHKLVEKDNDKNKVLIIPILEDKKPTWKYYTIPEIEQFKKDDDDFWGERMCKPSASKDVLFDRESLEAQEPKEVIRESAGFKIFKEFDPSHRTASGHDVAGGVGLDSSTSVFIDFDTVPAQVIATYACNTIKPDVFGYEVQRQSDIFGGSMAAIEKNNHGHATIAIAKQQNVKQYTTEGKEVMIGGKYQPAKEYGWLTSRLTKPKMLFAFCKAVEDGLINLNDKDLIQECKSYTRNDLMDDVRDPRLITRHFDLLIGAAIAWQMNNHAVLKNKDEEEMEILDTDF